jgi:hypothetical protein
LDFLFFKLLFKLLKFKLFSNFFQTCKLHSNIKSCIQIMMLKHLLLLKLLKWYLNI